MPVFDVRTAKEYAIAHIPGTINVFELEVDQLPHGIRIDLSPWCCTVMGRRAGRASARPSR
jgi:rhodanese-related sulfurtransferase